MEKRIEALERANRQLKIAVAMLAVLTVPRLVVPAAAQTSTPDVVRAKSFEIVKDGRLVVSLGVDDEGGILRLANNAGRAVAILGGGEAGDGGYLKLGTGNGQATVQAYASPTEGGALLLKRPDVTDGIWMRAVEGGGPAINMMNGCVNVLATRGMKFTTC